MLQQNGLVLRNSKLCGYGSDFLRAHYEMAKELSFHRILRDEAELRKGKLLLFGRSGEADQFDYGC